LPPKAAYPYFGRDVYFKTGRIKEAIKWYKKSLKYDPNDQLTLKRLRVLETMAGSKMIKAKTIVAVLGSSTRVGESLHHLWGRSHGTVLGCVCIKFGCN